MISAGLCWVLFVTKKRVESEEEAQSATETASAFGEGGMASAVDPEVGFRLVTDSKATCCLYSCARTKEMKQSARMQAKARDMDAETERDGRARAGFGLGPAASPATEV
jgi:hypothetical protein